MTPLQAISWAIVAVTLAALVLLAWRCWTRDGRVPLAALVPIASQLVWFVPGSGVDAEAFALFVPTFHGLQYLVIAWVFQLKEQSARPGFRPGVPRVLLETAQWAIASGVGAFLMFYLLPRAVPALAHAQTNLAGPCIVAGFQIHHFFVDGVIWKIRDPRVRASLAGNLLDLAGFAR